MAEENLDMVLFRHLPLRSILFLSQPIYSAQLLLQHRSCLP